MNIFEAAEKGNLERVKELVEAGEDINGYDGENEEAGKTALMHAAENGHLKIVKYLIDNGADVNAVDVLWNNTAFMFAAKYGHLNVVKYLIDKIDIHQRNDDGNTAFLLAYKHLNVIKYILDKSPVIDGYNVNEINNSGITMLIACISGLDEQDLWCQDNIDQFSIIQYLVNNRADLNIQDNNGSTALMHACSCDNLEIVKYLVENGAHINMHNDYGETALMFLVTSHIMASNNKNFGLDIFNYLIKKGAHIHTKDNDGNTLLIRCSSIPLLKILLSYGFDVNIQNNNGDTVLMYWIKEINSNHSEVNNELLHYLYTQGADPNIKNKEGKTIFDMVTNRSRAVLNELKAKNISKKKSNLNTLRVANKNTKLRKLPKNIIDFEIAPFLSGKTRTRNNRLANLEQQNVLLSENLLNEAPPRLPAYRAPNIPVTNTEIQELMKINRLGNLKKNRNNQTKKRKRNNNTTQKNLANAENVNMNNFQ